LKSERFSKLLEEIMMRRIYTIVVFLGVLGIGWVLPSLVEAQKFEGIIETRTLTFDWSSLDLPELREWQPTELEQEVGAPVRWLFGKSIGEIKALAEEAPEAWEEQRTTLYIKGESFRFDVEVSGGKTSTIFRPDKEVIWNIMWAQKSYLEISQRDMREMMKGLRELSERMAKQFGEALPEEAREPAKPKIKVRRTGEKKTINGFPCEAFWVQVGDEISEIWMTKKYGQLKKAFEKVMQTMQKAFPQVGPAGEEEKEPWELIKDYEGIPILEKKISGTTLEIEEVLRIEKKSVSSDIFEVPAGFERKSFKDIFRFPTQPQ